MNLAEYWRRRRLLPKQLLALVRYQPSRRTKRIPFPTRKLDGRKVTSLLERILTTNILPFWYPEVLDYENGGYRLNHDLSGKRKGACNKSLVSQARTLWFFSKVSQSRFGSNKHLEAAHHGYWFLSNNMRDKTSGGYFWEVDSAGANVTSSEKRLYGQAFVLYALSEYAIASEDEAAIQSACDLFELLEAEAHDTVHGGYLESFILAMNHSLLDGRHARFQNPEIKSMNTHLHLMEALEPYVALTNDPIAKERLFELFSIQSNTVVRKSIGACSESFKVDWTPVTGWRNQRVSYGHDLENIWLLIKVCKRLGLSMSPFCGVFKSIFDYTLRYGLDRHQGGLFYSGYFNSTADKREKVYWVQAESLVASLSMYNETGDQVYADFFMQTLDWITKHQIDWHNGDWFEVIEENGQRSGVKAGPWGSPYHHGRAMLECLDVLAGPLV